MDPQKKTTDGLVNPSDSSGLEVQEDLHATVEAIIHRANIDHRQNMIEFFNNCTICGSDLEFAHVSDFIYGTVKEEGYCPCCNVRVKNETHGLQ